MNQRPWRAYSCLLVIVLLGLATAFTQGQSPLQFEHLGTEQGLSHNRIFCIYQDRQGFMWFGTGDGLNRYDGYSFTVYKPDPGDPNNHMAHHIVWDVLESKAGDIWFVTPGGGLHRLDKRTGRINFFRVEQNGSNRFAPYDICYTMIEDKQGFFWIGSEGGLARFDPRTKQYKLFNIPIARGSDQRVWAIQEDRYGTLWIGTSNGLFTLNRQTGKFTPVYFEPDATQQPRVESMFLSSDNSLWVATKYKGIFRLLPKGGNATTSYRPTGQVYLTNQEILPKGLGEDQHHNLMVGTRNGLFQLNPQTGQFVNYQENPSVVGSLSHNVAWALLADNRGTFWIGTSNGIDHYSTLTPRFAFYQPIPDHNAKPRTANNVTMLAADKEGTIWFCNATQPYHNGIFRLNPSDHQTYVNYSSQPLTDDWLTSTKSTVPTPGDILSTLYCDRSGRIWMATSSGLHTLDVKGQFRHYPASFSITSIDEDRKGRLWVGGESTLAQFEPATGQYTTYRIDKDNPIGKGGGQINDILLSHTGAVWVSVGGIGVCKLDTRTGRFTNYHPPQVKNHKVFYSRDVTALSETADGAIWASTNIGGLLRIDPKTAAVSTFTIHDGLPDNHIVALLTDQMGMLWMATGKELCRLNPVTRQLRVFDQQDGLLSQIFSGACTRTPTGELAFGCSNGFVVFQPSAMGSNPHKPPVYITQVQVSDSSRLFPASPLTLAYHDNVISFNFVGLNYIAPKKNQYAYRLEGVNSDWVYCVAQRTATYSFLSPGKYVFRVKASNNDGVWNEQGAAIQLVILPPWWRTGWAYALYVLITLGSIWAFIVYRSRALRRENRSLEKKVAFRTQEVLEQKEEIEVQRDQLQKTVHQLRITQDRLVQQEKLASLGELTAGIAHEIQNPLNFVTNFSEVSVDLIQELKTEAQAGRTDDLLFLADDLTSNLEKIQRHGQRASRIVQGMLEHSRIGTGERQSTNLNALVEEYLKLAYQGRRQTGGPAEGKQNGFTPFTCQLVTELDPAIETIEVVPQDIGRVLLNLYNNAFYAVQQRQLLAGDTYQPTLRISTKRLADQVEIRISDNGTGIAESVKAKIFQPFFTTKPTGEGTGLGLSLSYDIVTKGHGGTLRVESQVGEGSVFIITLPLA